jgi:hypothetical protein
LSRWTPAALRVAITHRWRHGRWPRLAHPVTFNEHVQWRKLHDRDPRMPPLVDKLRVKDFAAELLGTDWIVPTLWHGDTLPPDPPWPRSFVVKSRHGCNQTAFVRTGTGDWPAIRRRAARWMRSRYGYWLDEWAYRDVPRGLLVEPFIGPGHTLPIDWKIYVFGGVARFVQVHLDRETDHRWIVMDRDWNRISTPRSPDPDPPQSLDRMLAAAEILGAGFDYVRVDFYEADGHPLFGEMTFYPGSGLGPFDPVALDTSMGREWRAGKSRLTAPV